MNIKKMLQTWETDLEAEAKQGNREAIEILDWLKKNRWLRFQRHRTQNGK